jgi:ABC-type phosphate transport system substrate-binding protein
VIKHSAVVETKSCARGFASPCNAPSFTAGKRATARRQLAQVAALLAAASAAAGCGPRAQPAKDDTAASDVEASPEPAAQTVKLQGAGASFPAPLYSKWFKELMVELKSRYTIAIVTHNLQQAARVADNTGFLYVDTSQGSRTGYLVEFGATRQVFDNPRERHTQNYISGEFS